MKLPSLINLGVLIIFIGILITIIGSFLTKTDSKVAVAGFIGPIPFGFGNDKTLLIIAIALSAFFLVLFLILNYRN